MALKPSVALVGAGSMGGALLRGWLDKGVIDAERSAVFDPAPGGAARAAGVRINPPVCGLSVDALVFAVKPQIAAEVLVEFSSVARRAVVISVMAGRTTASLASLLPGAAAIVRAMPNLPAAVGAGVTVLYAASTSTPDQRLLAEKLLHAVGDVIWVDNEGGIDAATAVSGSGPAYFFLLAEALAEAGCSLGLPESDAFKLARATISGAGAVAAVDPRSLADLRRAVASPGGTTEAALKILDGDDKAIRTLMKEAIAAARQRAEKLT